MTNIVVGDVFPVLRRKDVATEWSQPLFTQSIMFCCVNKEKLLKMPPHTARVGWMDYCGVDDQLLENWGWKQEMLLPKWMKWMNHYDRATASHYMQRWDTANNSSNAGQYTQNDGQTRCARLVHLGFIRHKNYYRSRYLYNRLIWITIHFRLWNDHINQIG